MPWRGQNGGCLEPHTIIGAVLLCRAPLQAMLAMAGDAQDAGLAHEVLDALLQLLGRESLARLPLLSCIERFGGPGLFLPLLQRPPLRVLGLKLMAACIEIAPGGPGGSASSELIAGAGELLAGCQLSPEIGTALFEIFCGAPWQVCVLSLPL